MSDAALEKMVDAIEALNKEIQTAKLSGEIDSHNIAILNELQFQATLTTTRLKWAIKQSRLKLKTVASS